RGRGSRDVRGCGQNTILSLRFTRNAVSIEKTASNLNAALRAFGETLGRSLAEGIAAGVQEGLARSLELERLANGAALPPTTVRALAAPAAPRRRGGRPRGEPKPCRIEGCPDPA